MDKEFRIEIECDISSKFRDMIQTINEVSKQLTYHIKTIHMNRGIIEFNGSVKVSILYPYAIIHFVTPCTDVENEIVKRMLRILKGKITRVVVTEIIRKYYSKRLE